MLPLLIHGSRVGDAAFVRTVQEMIDAYGVDTYLHQQQAVMSRHDYVCELPDIRVPTLVLRGREDKLTPVSLHEEIAQQVPDAGLVVIKQCGHLSTLERPAEVNAALKCWLSR